MKKCFVISPIGKEGSETREHADDVFDFIIKPAMDACGIVAFRADHRQKPGMISEQMFRAIFETDMSIALLTGHNPNVFYFSKLSSQTPLWRFRSDSSLYSLIGAEFDSLRH